MRGMLILLCSPLLFPAMAMGAAPPSRANGLDSFFPAMENALHQKRNVLLADDYSFFRRVWIDLAGRLPSLEEARAFADDSDPRKRARLIDEILDSEAFTHRWTHHLGELFWNRINGESTYRNRFHFSLQEMIASKKGWDEIAREILTEFGGGFGMGSSFNFWTLKGFGTRVRLDFLDDQMGFITESFLGVRTQCISCHDGAGHLEELNQGLVSKTREDFWAMAAFLAQTYFYQPNAIEFDDQYAFYRELQLVDVDLETTYTGAFQLTHPEETEGPLAEYLAQSQVGEGMRPPRNGGIIAPRYLFSGETPAPGEIRRHALARMITADRQFARAMVNRLWAHLFAEGFVEPLDNFDLARLNPEIAEQHDTAVQPRDHHVLEYLTDHFIESGFDIRALLRLLCNSRIYQAAYERASAQSGSHLTYWFSNRRERRLDAETIVDGIFQILDLERRYTVYKMPDQIFGTTWAMPDSRTPNTLHNGRNVRAAEQAAQGLGFESFASYQHIQLGTSALLDTFGRADRQELIPRKLENTIQNSLTLLNNPVIFDHVLGDEPAPYVAALIEARASDSKSEDAITRELFFRLLFREPTPAEYELFMSYWDGKAPQQAIPDMLWALLNHPDFLFR